MIRNLFCLILLLNCGQGCAGGKSAPLVAERLSAQQPVDAKRFQILNFKVNGEATNDVSPIRISPSEKLLLEGEIASGDWEISRICQMWRTNREDGGYSITAPTRSPKALELILRLHGDNVGTDAGVIDGRYVESRKNEKNSNHLEFRVSVKAPDKPGKYVVDITAFDLTRPTAVRGEDPNDVGGTAIWRRELFVE